MQMFTIGFFKKNVFWIISHGYVVTDKHIGCSCLYIICCRNAQYCGQKMQDRLAETPNIVDKRCKIGWGMLLSDWIWEWYVMPDITN
jgi:hypothetical protein